MTDGSLEQALHLRRAGRLPDAARIYSAILASEPANFDALQGLAAIRYQSGDVAGAEKLFGEMAKLRPQAADTVYNRACMLAKLNRADEALAAFDAAISLKPDYAEAIFNRGSLLASLSRYAEALSSFDRVAALSPAIPAVWSHRARILCALGRYGEAIASCDRALALKPSDSEARDIRAAALAAWPSLTKFENDAAMGDHGAALRTALTILYSLDAQFGRLDGIDTGIVGVGGKEDVREIARRFAASFAKVLCDPALKLSPEEYEHLVIHHRWLDLIFSLAGAGNAPTEQLNARKKLVLAALDSPSLEFDALWNPDPGSAAPAFLHYLAARCVFNENAFRARERLLEWLPNALADIRLSHTSLARAADAYMHCSYAVTEEKHAIKRTLMLQLRRTCLEAGCVEWTGEASNSNGKPVAIVVAENLRPGHSVYRTHARAVASLRERFFVLGAVYPDPKGTEIETLFDECLPVAGTGVFDAAAKLSEIIRARKPALVFYTGVGMVPAFVALASLRLAPVQCVSFGHTATTMSPAMDYFVLPKDFVGSESVFSEKVIAVPPAGMPLTRRAMRKPLGFPKDRTVRVAIPGSIMKLNPRLFDAIAAIAERTHNSAEFHFFPLGASGLSYAALAEAIGKRIPNATVFEEMTHEAYVERLARCDFFLSPFPYGNMNSIIDAFELGLPGVCLDGPEAHAHADGAYFARIGLPGELAALTVDDYIRQAVRLIEDAAWREQCLDIVARADLNAAFFSGDEKIFCAALAALVHT